MKHNLILVQLNDEQIFLAKEANGQRKQITHGVLCGPYGQLFGTEKICRKYYSVWSRIFPQLFDKSLETKYSKVSSYKETFNLVNILIDQHGLLEKTVIPNINHHQPQPQRPKGILARLWTRITGA